MNIYKKFYYFIFCYIFTANPSFDKPMYFVTCSDKEHFRWVKNLITSIQKYHYKKIDKINVFDLGMNLNQIKFLNSLDSVEVSEIEDTNPDMKKKFIINTDKKLVRGWYSWKPAILYESLRKFPYFLYLDAGLEVMGPLDTIFETIEKDGYFLYDYDRPIATMITKRIAELFDLNHDSNNWMLDEYGILAGIQGLSTCMMEPYILPVYKLSSNISLFEDDGSSLRGFGGARHDQSIFSIFARKLNLKIHKFEPRPHSIRYGDKKIYFGAYKHFKFVKYKENKKKLYDTYRNLDENI